MRRPHPSDRPWLIAGLALGFVVCTFAVINGGMSAERGEYGYVAFDVVCWLIGAIVAVGSATSLQTIDPDEDIFQ